MTTAADRVVMAETAAIRLLRDGFSPRQIFDKTGVTKERLGVLASTFGGQRPPTEKPRPHLQQVRPLGEERRRTPDELRAELRQMADRLPGRAPGAIAEEYAQALPADDRGTVLVLALTLLLQRQEPTSEACDISRNNIPVREMPPPSSVPAPSRKTAVVKDLVQARLETRVVVDGRRLRFAECNRDQVLQLQYKTEDAVDALRLHATWLGSVAEQMLTHRAETVADLPDVTRDALMEGKPE